MKTQKIVTLKAELISLPGSEGIPFRVKRGFTVVELVCAIGVTSVLAALLMSVFAQIKERSQTLQCLSNLRQCGIGFVLYATDHNGCIPFGYRPLGASVTSWRSDILPYLGLNSNVASPLLQCPSRCIKPPGNPILATYGGNPLLLLDAVSNLHAVPINLNNITRPTEIFLLTDAIQNPVSGYAGPFLYQMPDGYGPGNPADAEQFMPVGCDTDNGTNDIRWRHGSAANFLFVDGHVTIIQKGQLQQKNVYVSY